MKRNIKILLLILIVLFGSPHRMHGQKILTLKECYDRAASANALAGEKKGYADISRLKDANLVKMAAYSRCKWQPGL
jgi:hypothetical protein